MTDSQNLEPRIEAVEIDMQELKRSISDLKSTVSTLADIVIIHDQQHQDSMRRHEESMRRHDDAERRAEADRALMMQMIQAIMQGRNGGAE
jgi:DNA recombination-dependent growth factor C